MADARHLTARGISPVACAVGRSTQDVRQFVRAHGLPIVVKPIRESGSLGVFRVLDPADVELVAERFRRLGDKPWTTRDLSGADSFGEFLMEELLDGPEISVETLSFEGRHVVVAVTDKETGEGFVEIGHSQPSSCPAGTLREVNRLVTEFLDAVGLRNGAAHTEVKVTARGPRIVESHNRVGGDRINELTEIVYGVDLERSALSAWSDSRQPLTTSPEPRGGAAVRFLTPDPGRVIEVTGVDAVRADPACVEVEVKVTSGDAVPPLSWNEDKVGHVIARGATAADAVAQSKRLVAAIQVRTEPVA